MSYRLYCPRCEAMAVNGVACHEMRCPNAEERWVKRGRGENRHIIPENEESPSWLKPEVKNERVCTQ